MRLTYIIPAYNAEPYLERCVETLYMQDIPVEDFEIILVNDGSTDQSQTVAEKIKGEHSNVILYSQENGGAAVARNTGLSLAKGKYVSFVDADDFLIPHTILKVLEIAENKNAEICTFIMASERDTNAISYSRNKLKRGEVYTGEEMLLNHAGKSSVCSSLYSLPFLKENKLQLTVGITSEDIDFNLRAYIYAQRVVATNYVCYYYFNNTQSTTSVISTERKCKLLKDSICVNENLRKLSCLPQVSSTLSDYFSRRSASATVGVLMSLSRATDISKSEKKQLLEMLKEKALYPIKGRTLNSRSTIVALLLNCPFILKKKIGIK